MRQADPPLRLRAHLDALRAAGTWLPQGAEDRKLLLRMRMLLSVTQAAVVAGLSPSVLRGYCLQGRVKGAVRIGNRWAVPEKVLILPPARPVGGQRKARVSMKKRLC